MKKETSGRQGKTEGATGPHARVKLGCVFTQTKWDEEGYAIRDPDSTTYTGAIETAEHFGKRLYLEAWKRGWSCAGKKVVIGDGAEWIWNLAQQHFPARFRLSICFTRANTCGSWPASCTPTTRRPEVLDEGPPRSTDHGKIKKLTVALRSIETNNPELAKKIQTEADYFHRNACACVTPNSATNICSSARCH